MLNVLLAFLYRVLKLSKSLCILLDTNMLVTFMQSKQGTFVANGNSTCLTHNFHQHLMLFAKPIFLASFSNCLSRLLNTHVLYGKPVLYSGTLNTHLMAHSVVDLLFLAANLAPLFFSQFSSAIWTLFFLMHFKIRKNKKIINHG